MPCQPCEHAILLERRRSQNERVPRRQRSDRSLDIRPSRRLVLVDQEEPDPAPAEVRRKFARSRTGGAATSSCRPSVPCMLCSIDMDSYASRAAVSFRPTKPRGRASPAPSGSMTSGASIRKTNSCPPMPAIATRSHHRFCQPISAVLRSLGGHQDDPRLNVFERGLNDFVDLPTSVARFKRRARASGASCTSQLPAIWQSHRSAVRGSPWAAYPRQPMRTAVCFAAITAFSASRRHATNNSQSTTAHTGLPALLRSCTHPKSNGCLSAYFQTNCP